MKKISFLTVAIAVMLALNGCSGSVNTSGLSENLKAEYGFYEDSIGIIKNTMGLSQEEADGVFTILVTECGVDEKTQYIFKGNDDNTYTVWAGLLQLEVALKDNAVDTVMQGTEQIYPAVHKNPLTQAKVKTADVMNGSGTDKIGERAYIEISKEDLQNVTQEDFKEFAETIVKDSGYNYFTVICNDGTGVFFGGSEIIIVSYGKLNDEGMLEEAAGDILLQDNGEYIYEEKR